MGVSVSGDNFKDSVINGKDGYIESTTSKIEDQDVLFSGFFIQTIGDGGGGRFIQDSDYVHS